MWPTQKDYRFEGAYRVNPETLARIRDNLLRTLALVVLSTPAAASCGVPRYPFLNRDAIKVSINLEQMETLGSAAALRDSDTGAHSHRVMIYADRLAEEIGLVADRMRQLIAGAFFVRRGQDRLRDNILLKPGRHTEDETRRMCAHVSHDVAILGKSQCLQHTCDVDECHHERFDGRGYPRGLAGEATP